MSTTALSIPLKVSVWYYICQYKEILNGPFFIQEFDPLMNDFVKILKLFNSTTTTNDCKTLISQIVLYLQTLLLEGDDWWSIFNKAVMYLS